ncbi:MAG: DNA polymerase III subunit gamma/tau, partial [Sphaerospermopsis sp. SIO1G2]|nr:DNA polymerase III subunit gamma/tau [Sphaerospermopsis sp. SIO1G2]
MSDESPALGLDLAASDAVNQTSQGQGGDNYLVLARKYRPKDFSTLIGQEVLVRTLSNAFASGRLAHAFLLSGVRGVGKTTTARILAKAFNCTGEDGTRTTPTPHPCGKCANCLAIAEDRHVDVLEIDAASNNGVDYIRELQDELHYKPVQGRFRIYIVDEVHMLSTSAFNAFLKTLEEPPEHVKFIFATTEANKLPITIRSRCQRFDLRRVTAAQLKEHYVRLCALEGVDADDEALSLIAQAADGSVRDGLSMLDQAISMLGAGTEARVTAAQVREMLGLNDGERLRRMFDLVHSGDTKAALDLFAELFADGADPTILARELCTLTHLVTRHKLVGEDVAILMSASEKDFLAQASGQLSLGALNRTWELLIQGLDELKSAN